MPSQLTTKTTPELLLQIVSAERDCPSCFGKGVLGSSGGFGNSPPPEQWGCVDCGGIGKVPILDPKLMRLPCPNCAGTGHIYSISVAPALHRQLFSRCQPCKGEGWMPNPDAWAMKKALHRAEYYLAESHAFMFAGNKPWGAHCYHQREAPSDQAMVWDADPERARYLAVVKVFENRARLSDFAP